jgi:hypothetical protein
METTSNGRDFSELDGLDVAKTIETFGSLVVVVGSAEGGPLAPALMVIGSVINTGLLIWDSPEILNGIASLFDNSATKNARAIWLNLTAPLDENDELYRLYAELEAFHSAPA